jgi:hypothetical protein
MKFKHLAVIAVLLAVRATAQQDGYFQQEVNYKIRVELNDETHTLRGFEEFEYKNNSNQDLDYLIIHLWPNAYKNEKTAMAKQKFMERDYFMLWAGKEPKGYIDSLNFEMDGETVKWEYLEGYEDIAILYPAKPIAAGSSVKVTTPFFVKLPSGSISRLGHVGQSYQITQWYPKPAVFDKNGWHDMPYLTQGEFYSEFGSYDVSITLPENYVVGATGDLQTQSEIDWLNQLATQSGTAADVLNSSADNKFPPSSKKMKTLRYVQQNVHDFGWFADKRWIVRKSEVELPHSKRKVTTWAMFTPQNREIWEAAGLKSIADGLHYYSLWAGDYPYNQCTAVDGTISAGGGMEYPNVTVIGNVGNESSLKTVIIHEVGHNWFYGILGSNERDHAWMDEGINSFFETRTLLATNPKMDGLSVMTGNTNLSKILAIDKYSYSYLTEELPYLLTARGANDQPMQAPSEYFTGMNYGTIVYKKSAIAFNFLMNYLGEEVFNNCMRTYFETWKFRHPGPRDIRKIFESVSGKNLSWFFDDMVQTTDRMDYKVAGVKMQQDSASVKIRNTGGMASPFSVDLIRNGVLMQRNWYDGIDPGRDTKIRIDAEKGDLIKVNYVDGIPEYNKNDNLIRTTGLMKKVEPTKLSFGTNIDDPQTSQLFWMPMVGWNNYNKWMLGVQFHNRTIPSKNWTWSLSPMFSISTTTLNGFANVGYNNGKFGFGVNGKRFAQATFPYDDNKNVVSYDVISPYVQAQLFPDRIQKDWTGEVKITYFSLGQLIKNEDSKFVGEYTQVYPEFGEGPRISHVRMEARVKKKNLRSDIELHSRFEGGEYTNYGVMHEHELRHDWVYKGKGKRKIHSRLYYGAGDGFYYYAAGQYGGMRYDKNSPGINNPGDYTFDGLYLGRNETEGILSQQIVSSQGGLAAPTQQSANGHLLSAIIRIDAPVRLPLQLYGGVNYMRNRKDVLVLDSEIPGISTNTAWRWLWNAGVAIPLIPDVFCVYVPLAYSENIRSEVKARDLSFGQTIMFELNLNQLNPFTLIKKAGI